MPKTIIQQSRRLLTDADPVFLELYLGLYALLSGVLLYVRTNAMTEPAIRAAISAGPPRWFLVLLFSLAGLLQVASTIYESRWLGRGAAGFLALTWLAIGMGVFFANVYIERPMALATPVLVGLAEFVVFLKQARLFHEGK